MRDPFFGSSAFRSSPPAALITLPLLLLLPLPLPLLLLAMALVLSRILLLLLIVPLLLAAQPQVLPLDVDLKDSTSSADPMVTMCDLADGLAKYAAAPHDYPKYRDVVSASKCSGASKSSARLSTLLGRVDAATALAPTAFIFHESRVGSTLISNMLAADPRTLVFSESRPPADVLFHCPTCTDAQRARHLRAVFTLMGANAGGRYDRLFFKFQSILAQRMHVVLAVYPDVPWVFVYRAPVQVPCRSGASPLPPPSPLHACDRRRR